MGNVIETVLLGALGSLMAAEIVFRHRIWCVRIINAAANRISDPNEREVRREEWLAGLNDQIGLYASFKHAIGCYVGAPAVAAVSKIPVKVKSKSAQKLVKNMPATIEEQVRAAVQEAARDIARWTSVVSMLMGVALIFYLVANHTGIVDRLISSLDHLARLLGIR